MLMIFFIIFMFIILHIFYALIGAYIPDLYYRVAITLIYIELFYRISKLKYVRLLLFIVTLIFLYLVENALLYYSDMYFYTFEHSIFLLVSMYLILRFTLLLKDFLNTSNVINYIITAFFFITFLLIISESSRWYNQDYGKSLRFYLSNNTIFLKSNVTESDNNDNRSILFLNKGEYSGKIINEGKFFYEIVIEEFGKGFIEKQNVFFAKDLYDNNIKPMDYFYLREHPSFYSSVLKKAERDRVKISFTNRRWSVVRLSIDGEHSIAWKQNKTINHKPSKVFLEFLSFIKSLKD